MDRRQPHGRSGLLHPDQQRQARRRGATGGREKNVYGQILRWRTDRDDHASNTFAWDLFVVAGNPQVHAGTPKGGSSNITPQNMFNSPDGLAFDKAGRLWIQTDGDSSNAGDFAGMGNNQMLCADPATGRLAAK